MRLIICLPDPLCTLASTFLSFKQSPISRSCCLLRAVKYPWVSSQLNPNPHKLSWYYKGNTGSCNCSKTNVISLLFLLPHTEAKIANSHTKFYHKISYWGNLSTILHVLHISGRECKQNMLQNNCKYIKNAELRVFFL